ncbi:MAG: hypothetical protein PHD34_03505, partial [Methanothrix soehngenii]|nr:hypothetical protein [Methanothrix soehngenii]
MDLMTTANITLAITVVIIWGISFLGLSRHLISHSTQKDNGFIMLLSAATSLAVAIASAAAGSEILKMLNSPSAMDLMTTANIALAVAIVATWAVSFVAITRHLKSHSTQA